MLKSAIFYNEMQVLRLWDGGPKTGMFAVQHNQIRLRLVGEIILRGNVDWSLDIHKSRTKDLDQPADEQGRCIHMRAILPHFVDQFPFDQLDVLEIGDAGRFESTALGAGPSLARRDLRDRR
jgi:hypothetical protein